MDYNSLLTLVTETASAQRILQLEDREKYAGQPKGDWEGTSTGIWQRINADGTGEVLVNGTPYTVVTKSETSIPKGTNVQVSFSNGQYIATW